MYKRQELGQTDKAITFANEVLKRARQSGNASQPADWRSGLSLIHIYEGMPGVNVQVKGTTTGTITDFDGNYSIDVPDSKSTLVFSFIGYVTPVSYTHLSD